MHRPPHAALVAALLALLASGCTSGDDRDHDALVPAEHGTDGRGEVEGGRPVEEGKAVVSLSPEAAARVRIRVAPVAERMLSGMLTTTGQVDFDQDRLAHVSPRIPGRVHRVQTTLGDRVRAGEPLAVIDSIELGRAKSAFLRATVQLELARRTRAREEGLLQDRITSEQSVLEARSAEASARAAYQAARQELRLLGLSEPEIDATSANDGSAALFPLASPIDGTVVEKHVTLGEVVSPERHLFTVADLSQVWVWIDVYEGDLARVHLEDDVAVRVEAFPEHTFEGKVAYVRSQVDPDTRTARARIDVTNTDRHLRPGMFATVTVSDPHGPGGEAAPATLVVPSSAVQRDGEQQIAFVRTGEHRYERRVLALGRRTDAWVEVLDGLAAGEPVAVEGTFLLKSEAARQRLGGGHDH